MKPEQWESFSPTKKDKLAKALLESPRGHYIISQALCIASKQLQSKEFPEPSNAQDMEMLYERLFTLFVDHERLASQPR